MRTQNGHIRNVEHLRAVLDSEPRREAAVSARIAREMPERRRERDRRLVAEAVRKTLATPPAGRDMAFLRDSYIEGLPPHLRDEARRQVEEISDRERRRRKKAAEERVPGEVGRGEPFERIEVF